MHEAGGSDELISGRLRTTQIVAGGLVAGIVIFLVVVLIVVQQGPAPARPAEPIMTYFALAFFGTSLGVWSFLPAQIARKQVDKIAAATWRPRPQASPGQLPDDTSQLLTVFQTKLLVGYGMLEGASSFACVAYLVDRDAVSLGVVAATVLLMLLSFPTRGRLNSWLEQQQSRLDVQRQLGDRTEPL
jgi:hypothetical protein